jgi:predicted secreted protein
MIQTYLLGRDAKLYVGAPGSTPTTEIKDVKDLTVTLNQAEIDVTTRKAKGWKVFAGGLREVEVSFGLLVPKASAEGKLFLNAYKGAENGTAAYLAMKIIDTDEDGIFSFDADWLITECSEDQNLEDAIKFSVKAKPTIYDDTRVPTLTIT